MLDRNGATAARASRVLMEALAQGVDKAHKVKFIPSVQNPGKVQIEIDGMKWPEEFEQNEARAFASGFTFGFSVGAGMKNNADGIPARLK
jgi:hypothetical protein